MNTRPHAATRPLVFVVTTLVGWTLLAARAPALEPSSGGHPEHRARASLANRVMCVVEPVDPPPCAKPVPSSR
jgi:hypothetical protein